MGRIAGTPENILQPRRPGAPANTMGNIAGNRPISSSTDADQFRGNVGRAHGGLTEAYGPEALAGQAQQLYALLAGSPAFASLLRNVQGTASNAQTAIASNLGRTGASGSGVGAATAGLASQLPAYAAGQARGDLFGQALQAAMANLAQRLQALPAIAQQFQM
jgi:hypothetical protein